MPGGFLPARHAVLEQHRAERESGESHAGVGEERAAGDAGAGMRLAFHRMVRKSLWLNSTVTRASRARADVELCICASRNSRQSFSSSGLGCRARMRSNAVRAKVSESSPVAPDNFFASDLDSLSVSSLFDIASACCGTTVGRRT